MDEKAVRHAEAGKSIGSGQGLIAIALAGIVLAASLILTAGFGASPAGAKPIRKDGRIHACYRVKGKPRGDMRILVKGKRCRRGERKVAWTAAAGAPRLPGGGTGQGAGPAHGAGPSGSADSSLSTRLDALESRTTSLEKALEESNAAVATLTTKVASLELANVDLGNTVGLLCGQLSTVSTRWNELLGVVDPIASGVLGLLPLLEVPALPSELDPFSCG